MAIVIEGGVSPGTANSWINLYGPVPTGKRAIVTLSACNTTASAVTVKAVKTLSVSSPNGVDHIEFNAPVTVGTPLERTGILLGQGKYLAVQASAAGMSFQYWGLLEDDA